MLVFTSSTSLNMCQLGSAIGNDLNVNRLQSYWSNTVSGDIHYNSMLITSFSLTCLVLTSNVLQMLTSANLI